MLLNTYWKTPSSGPPRALSLPLPNCAVRCSQNKGNSEFHSAAIAVGAELLRAFIYV
jgi:hypothetical protein